MNYLNEAVLTAVSAEEFQRRPSYRWTHIDDTLTTEGFALLHQSLPSTETCDKHVGAKRAHGQMSHDRFMLHYRNSLELLQAWHEFIAELNGPEYRTFLRRMLGNRRYIPTFSWHYAWEGCSLSPHCDAARKRATHIFHFNSPAEWDQAWGGQTLILGSDKPIPTHSALKFDELIVAGGHDPIGNGSLLFQRTPHSWHGMKR